MKRRFRAAHKKSLIDELAVNIQTDASEALNRLAQQIAKPTADLKNSYLRLKTQTDRVSVRYAVRPSCLSSASYSGILLCDEDRRPEFII